ncbi:hypothetical protein, partial [Salmonella sp. SAL4448]|uniref:hypothetical protein n=1 Tax=Salmonella sp. SAL4448 TaxID=3159903 RepID=UPI0039789BA3
FEKKLTLTLNVIDPLLQQQSRVVTYGSNFTLENVSTTQTRNIRVTASYNLAKMAKKKAEGAATKLRQPKTTPQSKKGS